MSGYIRISFTVSNTNIIHDKSSNMFLEIIYRNSIFCGSYFRQSNCIRIRRKLMKRTYRMHIGMSFYDTSSHCSYFSKSNMKQSTIHLISHILMITIHAHGIKWKIDRIIHGENANSRKYSSNRVFHSQYFHPRKRPYEII